MSCTETGLCKYLASLDLSRSGFEELNMPGTVIVIIFSHQLLRVVDTSQLVADANSFQSYLQGTEKLPWVQCRPPDYRQCLALPFPVRGHPLH